MRHNFVALAFRKDTRLSEEHKDDEKLMKIWLSLLFPGENLQVTQNCEVIGQKYFLLKLS